MVKKHIVIVGANFAGLCAAKEINNKLKKSHIDYQITLIDKTDHFEWTPNIHEILSGVKNTSDLILSRQLIAKQLGHQFIKDEVLSMNASANMLTLKNSGPLSFDTCLIAVGHELNDHGIKSARKHALGFRTAAEVAAIKQKIEDRIKDDLPVNIAIVGGGYSGVEALGELLRQYRQQANLHITLVEPSSRILKGLPETVAKDIMRLAAEQNVSFRLGEQVTSVTSTTLTFKNSGKMAADVVIWAAGTKLPALASNIQTAAKRKSGIEVDEYLQIIDHPHIFVAGDAAGYDASLKKQAYHAMNMGTVAGRNMAYRLIGKRMESLIPQEKPIALAFGDLNTYLIQGETVFASPLLATAKEIVYQLYMTQMASPLSIKDVSCGIAERFSGSIKKLLLPELKKLTPRSIISNSKVLNWGDRRDVEAMTKAMYGSVLEVAGIS